MSYLGEWKSIFAKIEGIKESAELLASFKQAGFGESYGSYKETGKACYSAASRIYGLLEKYDSSLPLPVKSRIEEFFAGDRWQLMEQAKSELRAANSATVMLLALRAEIQFLLTDEQERIRSITERAFIHLQRMLAVNRDVRVQWMEAFEENETKCEALGALHLLLFGIFAFKADSAGARTDLIFSERQEDFDSRGVEGLVLTEWKVASPSNSASKFREAREQMKIYQNGPLSGIELSGTRYSVVVTRKQIPASEVPADLEEKGIVCRHINIAIEPDYPSRQARAAGRHTQP